MATRTTINISLTRELESFITRRVRSGRYQSASEVVREGLRLLQEHERARQGALDDFHRKIASGLGQIARGEVVDGESVFRKIRQRSRRRGKRT